MTAAAWVRWMLLFTLLDLGLVGYQFGLRPDRSDGLRGASLYRMADRYAKAGRIDEAVKVHEVILRECASAPIAPRAAWELAEIQMRRRFRPDEARATLRDLLDEYPESDQAQRAASSLRFLEIHSDFGDEPLRRWLRASETNRAGDHAGAQEILSSLIRDYPSSSLRPLAKETLARFAREGSGSVR